MKNLDVIVANNTYSLLDIALKRVGKFIDNANLENIIIVPDRLSLICEQKIFDVLGIDVYFNLSVMGISKFAKMIIKESGLDAIECSNLTSKLITLKAIQNVCNDFKCFSKKYTLGFVDEIYAKIEQIKSSGVDINDLYDENASIGTKLKFEDLKLIYNEYENLRGDRLDSGTVLELFTNASLSSNYLKNCNVFFMGFDSLTKQGLLVLKNVILNANHTEIAVTVPYSQDNGKIYDTSFFKSIQNLNDKENISCNYIWEETQLNGDRGIILKNLFTKSKTYKSDGYISIYDAEDFFDEIETCVKSINFLLKTKDIDFKDIAICAPDDYGEILYAKLKELGIDAYLDKKYPLIFFEPVKYILAKLSYIENPSKENFISIISNDFNDLDSETKYTLINLIQKYLSPKTILKYEKNLSGALKLELQKFIELESVDKNLNILDYIKLTQNIIKNDEIYKKIDNFALKLKNLGETQTEKLYVQMAEKLNNALVELGELEQKINLSKFNELLLKTFSEIEISGLPMGVNQITIANYKSFFTNVKYLYLLGLNEGVTPEILQDSGLIDDGEIQSETILAKLEPTTKIINKRNKFKLFEMLTLPSVKCNVFYSNFNADGKPLPHCDFVDELKLLFGISPLSTDSLKLPQDKLSINHIMYNAKNIFGANREANLNNNNINRDYVAYVLSASKKRFEMDRPKKLDVKLNEILLNDNKISVSLVEQYNKCPKSAFLARGLGLKPMQNDKIEPIIFGTFIHSTGELFVKNNINVLGTMTSEDIEKSVENITVTLLNKDEYYVLLLDENAFILKMLKKECVRFCAFLNYEQQVSEFKPKYMEKYFGKNSEFKPIELDYDGQKYEIGGFVDRIDFCGDNFRIIDYKTGNQTNAKGKEHLFYGEKIQLFVYARAIEQNVKKDLFGVFYLPITNSFTDGDELYMLSGFFENDIQKVTLCDKNIFENQKSNILSIRLNKPDKNGEVKLTRKTNVLSKEELKSYLDYAIECVKIAIKNISSGIAMPLPLDNACTYCEFCDICNMANDESVRRSYNYNVSSENILNLTNKKIN